MDIASLLAGTGPANEPEASRELPAGATRGSARHRAALLAVVAGPALLLPLLLLLPALARRPGSMAARGWPVAAYDAHDAYGSGADKPFVCEGGAAELLRGTGDGQTWRCSAGACIWAVQHCDGVANCYDHSDEINCGDAAAASDPESALAAVPPAGTAAANLVDQAPALAPRWQDPAPAPSWQEPTSTPSLQPPAPVPAPAPPGSSSSNSAGFPWASSWQPTPPLETSGGSHCTEKSAYVYQQVWKAQGTTFFDDWNYMQNDENSGAAQYLAREDAISQGVTAAYDTHAILRPGPRAAYLKRASAKLETKPKWTYFLLAAKFNNVPWGCGLWPAFWTHSRELAWPNGGELDMLEYSNEIASRSSLHVGLQNACQLDQEELRKPGCPQYIDSGFNFTGDYQCVTHYPDKIGCAPNRLPLQSGEQMSGEPFVLATEWTESFVKIFRIPAAEMPMDLATDAPQPDDWDRWLVSYYPFAASERNHPGSCPNPEQLMRAQQLVMSLGFCGDWASKVWLNSTCANAVGPSLPSECVAVDPHNPMGEIPAGPRDCCTAFIYDEDGKYGADAYVAEHGYFNVSWIKVYQHVGRRLASYGDIVT